MLKHLLIAEDHPVAAASISFAAQEVDSTILTEIVESFSEVQEKLTDPKYDGLVLDLNLSDSKGIVNVGIARGINPTIPILVITAGDVPGLQRSVRNLGANGYLHKSSDLKQIGEAITAILAGESYFAETEDSEDDEQQAVASFAKLSRAQLVVARELISGSPNKIIAFRLGISEPTVKTHLSAIFRALEVNNRSEAILRLQSINASFFD